MCQAVQQPSLSQRNFGGVGLLQTPTARVAPLGTLSAQYSQVDPYSYYTFSFQPFERIEAGFRYVEIDNRTFFNGTQTFIDKGFDIKLQLLEESFYRPAVAVGFQDIAGTSLFGAEYVVASKRFYDFDFTLGIGWGYLGGGDTLGNPLGLVTDKYDGRDGRRDNGPSDTGDFNLKKYFSGPASVIGGIEYHAPVPGVTLQIELDGNDYKNEPQRNSFNQKSIINYGINYRLNNAVEFSAGWQRGTTASFGVTFNLGLAHQSQAKSDPPQAGTGPAPPQTTKSWQKVSNALSDNAGLRVSRIIEENNTLIVEGQPTKYRSIPETEIRAGRILHNVTDAKITEFRYRMQANGFYLREDVLPRAPLPQAPFIEQDHEEQEFADYDYRHSVYSQDLPPAQVERPQGETLFTQSPQRLQYGLGPGLDQNVGGPDGYLYQALLRLTGRYQTDANGFFSGEAVLSLFDNLDNADFIARSDLPRVRTLIVSYLRATDLGIRNLQYTRTKRLGNNWFAQAYAGILELQYAGAGGEVLYRPYNSPVALGVDLNWVRQREFEQRFGFRGYQTLTGHATAYVETGVKNILAKISVGRYLARDLGITFDFSRRFASGVRLGAYATFTDAGNQFGEGDFDKGIYLSVPFDALFSGSSRQYGTVAWSPLTRDGGARLDRRFGLYGLTEERDTGVYWADFEHE